MCDKPHWKSAIDSRIFRFFLRLLIQRVRHGFLANFRHNSPRSSQELLEGTFLVSLFTISIAVSLSSYLHLSNAISAFPILFISTYSARQWAPFLASSFAACWSHCAWSAAAWPSRSLAAPPTSVTTTWTAAVWRFETQCLAWLDRNSWARTVPAAWTVDPAEWPRLALSYRRTSWPMWKPGSSGGCLQRETVRISYLKMFSLRCSP